MELLLAPLYDGMLRSISLHDLVGAIGGAVAYDDPSEWSDRLCGDGAYRSFDERCLIPGRSHENVG